MKIRLVVALVASRFASPILAQQTDKIDQQMAHQRRLNIPGLLPVKVGDGTTLAQFRVANPAAFADFSTRDRQQPRWPFSPEQRAGDRDVSQDLTCNDTLRRRPPRLRCTPVLPAGGRAKALAYANLPRK
jgi:hypothetical protein